jgi:predicted DNA-binding mobile mystery protein A
MRACPPSISRNGSASGSLPWPLERSEAKGTIELATLRRVAEAHDCTPVYALVPKKTLESIVRDRARILLRRRAPVEHSMLLEDEAVNAKDSEARLDEFVREANPSPLRDEP